MKVVQIKKITVGVCIKMTLDNPQQLTLRVPLPFLKGKKVEVFILRFPKQSIDATD